MTTRPRYTLAILVLCLGLAGAPPARAVDYYWDTDTSTSGNAIDGTGLGGTGSWDLLSTNWWDQSTLIAWPNTTPDNADRAIFTYAYAPGLPTYNTVTLDSGIVANQLAFLRSGYTLTGGTLTLDGTAPALFASLGTLTSIESQILGSAGLTMTGGGTIRLANNANSYTGTTTLASGSIIITNQSALGADPSPIVVTGFNPVTGATYIAGFSGGSLVLDGTGGAVNITRDLSLQGLGPNSRVGAALVSSGVNTLSGTVTMSEPYNGTNQHTRIIAADGTLNITGPLNVLGTAGTTISSLGGINQAGASFYNVAGTLAGTGTLETSGGGTLFLNPSDSSGFSGTIRVSGSAASGQSTLRIDSPNVLGTRTATGSGGVLDLNGGTLTVLMDSPSVLAGGAPANVYGRDTSILFADHTPNSSVKDQTVTFGSLYFQENENFTFNSRNGYGMSFTTATVNGTTYNSTFTNNLQGGALLSFNGDFWSNTSNSGNRTMTIAGNGDTRINGSIKATSAAYNHSLVKSGSGTLTITGTGSTLDGNVTVQNGTLAINDFRALNMHAAGTNTGQINLGYNSGTTNYTGTLAIVGNNLTLANLTTNTTVNLAGTTGGAVILANQTGKSPGAVFNADFTATGAGAKRLTLGGTNTGANTINGAIVDSSSPTTLTKIDAGTWVLAGTNTYTGNTRISNGILRLKANAPASTIINDASIIEFSMDNEYGGATLEFVGQPGANNVETLGPLYFNYGASTLKLTPGSGGTASLIFASLTAPGVGGTLNIVAPTANDTVSFITAPSGSTNDIANAALFYNGADFAFVPGAGQPLRAPIYGDGLGGGGTDTEFVTSATALTAAMNNEVTGSFATGSALSIDSLKIDGAHTLTLDGNLTIRTRAVSTASGGLIQTGGSGVITGPYTIGTGGSGALAINVDGGANSLEIQSTLSGTGGFIKSGAGTLRLAGANTQDGTIRINEGAIRLVDSGKLGDSINLILRQDGILELNGATTPATTINDLKNNGIIRNTSATTDVTLTVGGTSGTGDSYGIIEDGGPGKINLVKTGSGAQKWLGLSTYTGTTTIGGTGIVSINNLQDGGLPSGIGASSNAASNLVFNGTSTIQAYGGLSYTGPTNDNTDRLFTFNGGANGGVRIQSNGVNHATSSWTNTGALAFGSNATGNPQGLVLGGASTGDNRFFPQITDNGTAATSLYKADAGLWHLEATNTYTGPTTIRGGTLAAVDGVSLPTASNLLFDGSSGSLASTGTFSRTLGTGSGQVQWSSHASGGFSAGGSPLSVDFGDGHVWGTTAGFLNAGALLLNGSGVAKSDVDVISSFEITQGTDSSFNATTKVGSSTVTVTSGTTAGLTAGQVISGNANIPDGRYITAITGPTTFTLNSSTGVTAGTNTATNASGTGYRQVNVTDFTSIGADFATISGVISGAGNLAKEGNGILNLRGANTYTGQTLVRAGTLVVESLGSSGTADATSVGDQLNANTDASAVALGNGATTGGILEYVGPGETSDRKIRLNTTTGWNQIHADGVGPLILTNVANDMTDGNKILYLRGTNAGPNMITSVLADIEDLGGGHTGKLALYIDSSATWILTGDNTYSGYSTYGTTVSGGALGVGHDNALGSGTLGPLVLYNGTVFAYGGDRTIANPVTEYNSTGSVAAFVGEHSLTFTGAWTNTTTSSSGRYTRNNIVAGETLTIAGDYTFTAVTSGTNWNFDGTGDTIISGKISNTQGTIGFTYGGTGSLTLSGANSYNGNTTLANGTIRLGASGVIPDGTGKGNVIFNPAAGVTATLDLNGQSETINGLTANSLGTAVIDNTSASPATLVFGANDQPVSFGGGIGTYTITDSGAGALSIVKAPTASTATSVTIPTGVTLTYSGTTGVQGGTFTIASPVNGTTALEVQNTGSKLRLTGGITAPGAISRILVEDGATLSLLDGAGNKIDSLTSLELGSTDGTMTSLNLNVGDGATPGDELNTDLLTLLTGGTLTLYSNNQVTFNLTDAGLNAGQTYDLLSVADGGITSGNLVAADWLLGATPGGFSSMTLNVTDNLIQLQTGTLVSGTFYWRGQFDNTWNGAFNNWSTDKAGTTPATTLPGQDIDVVFAYDGASGALVTTLEQNLRVKSLKFESGTSTPNSVTIDPGTADPNSRIEIAPASSAAGIEIAAGGPATVTISGPVKLGADQTWTVTDASAVLSLGSLRGEADVTKAGAGKVILTGAADPTFNPGVTSDFTISGGTLELQNAAALGNPINANLANVSVGAGAAFYYNGAAGTVANPLTLAGGTLSAGTTSQIYSGTVGITADSVVNLRDNNSATLTDSARSITLSGALSGSGKLTLDSNSTVSGGNQYTGYLYLTGDNSGWSGGVDLTRGTIQSKTETGLGTGNITAGAGRIQFVTAGGTTHTLNQNITVDAPGGILELSADASGTPTSDLTVNLNGTITIGSASNADNALRFSQATDNFSVFNITGPIVLGNNASITYQGSATRPLVIPSIISDGGAGYSLAINDELYGWGVTGRTVRLTGANTFSGNISLKEGTLEFDTVTDAGGAASSLGQGTAITMAGGTLSFIGSSSQSTNRPITQTGSATYSANGTGGASITYNGAINAGATYFTLTGSPGSAGIIAGGITQTGDSVDATVNGGTWTHQTGTSRVGDQFTVTGANTIFNLDSGLFQVRDDADVTAGANLNLNAPGVLSFNTPTLTSGTLRVYTGGTVTLGANDAVNPTEFDELRIGTDYAGTGTFNMGTFNQTVTGFLLGNRSITDEYVGIVNGTGTLTATTNLDLYTGTMNANLASSGSTSLDKIGSGTVTLAGDNSGLGGTESSRLYAGTLILDYTTSNTTKLRAASALDLRGATLQIVGNNSAATSQSVANTTLGSNGSSAIQVSGGTGQDAVLNLGAITRANHSSDGTLRFILPAGTQSATHGITTTSPNSTFGLLGTGSATAANAAYATVDDGTGTWFATGADNGTNNNVVALASTPKDDVTTWAAGDHITDSLGFYGASIGTDTINSLRFNAAAGSDLAITSPNGLTIASGGILVTSNVGGTPSITGGTLASDTLELIVTQDSTQPFEIGSDIGSSHALTKTGPGTLILSGNNTYTDETEIQQGTLQVGGGNALPDTSYVTLAIYEDSTLELLGDETIGRLSGGQRANYDDHGLVAVGTHTLTVNETADTSYSGVFTGTGNIVKQGAGNLQLYGISSGFTGILTVDVGTLYFTYYGQIDAPIIRVNKDGALMFDQNGTSTRPGTHVPDTTAITLDSADGTLSGSTIVRGLAVRTNQDTTVDETVGVVTAASGANYVGMEATSALDDSDILVNDLVRLNNATLNVRGTNLGDSTTAATTVQENEFRIGDDDNRDAFMAEMIGGGGAADSTNISIVPWIIGESTAGALADVNMGNSLVTYDAASGIRPLSFSSEYAGYGTAGDTLNVRETLTTDALGLPGRTLNSLVLHNGNTAASTIAVTGAGAGQSITDTSGTFLLTLNPAADASSAHQFTVSGFDDGILVGGGEYVFFVVNPSSAATTPTLTLEIASPLASAADLTKSGRGTLILSGANTVGPYTTYGGATTINEGMIYYNILSPNTLTLDDTVTGYGGLGLTGAGTLVFATPKTYLGPTLIDDGTLKIAAHNALPITTAVRIGTGTTAGTLDLDGFSQTIGSLTVESATDAVTNTIVIDTGNTLTVNGAVTLGVNADASSTAVTATGGGALVVNSGGANFQIGGATGSTNDNRVTVDFSGLNSFTANLGAGTFRLGDGNSGLENNACTLTLAVNNTITADKIRIADGSGGAYTHTLTLGSGTNVFNADTINVGSTTTVRSGAMVKFDPDDTTGTFTMRASDGTSRATLNMISTTGSTSGSISSTIDLRGHTADLLIDTLTMARRTTNSGGATATLSFDQGTLDVTTIDMATRTDAGTGNATATLNIGGGTATIGALNMAVNTSAGGTVTADVNVSGGTVAIGTGTGTAINMANAGTDRTVTSTIDLTGGTVDVTGDIVRTGGAGIENATVTLAGAALDMNGNDIGDATLNIGFAAESGTLTNLGELNGGGTLTKTTAGTLTLDGLNTYTGATSIQDGTLVAASNTALGSPLAGTTVTGGTATGQLLLANDVSITGETLTLEGRSTTAPGFGNQSGTNTWAGNVDLGTGGTEYTIESVAGALAVTGPISAGTLTGTLDLNLVGAGTGTLAGAIDPGTGGATLNLEKGGTGTWTLATANTYNGTTLITGGTLEAAATDAMGSTTGVTIRNGTLLLSGTATNRINDTAPVTLDYGQISAPVTETFGALTLSNSSIIDMGTGPSLLTFADSFAQTWNGILSIHNWSGTALTGGGTDQLYFIDQGAGGFALASQQVQFYSDAGDTPLGGPGNNVYLPSGELVPIPEPATGFGALLLAALVLVAGRRRAARTGATE